jgi:hypothetical protein
MSIGGINWGCDYAMPTRGPSHITDYSDSCRSAYEGIKHDAARVEAAVRSSFPEPDLTQERAPVGIRQITRDFEIKGDLRDARAPREYIFGKDPQTNEWQVCEVSSYLGSPNLGLGGIGDAEMERGLERHAEAGEHADNALSAAQNWRFNEARREAGEAFQALSDAQRHYNAAHTAQWEHAKECADNGSCVIL